MGKRVASTGGCPRHAAALAVVCVVGGLLAAACSSPTPSRAAPTATIGSASVAPSSSQAARPSTEPRTCSVGFTIDHGGTERSQDFEGPAIEAVLDTAGAKYTVADARGIPERQAAQIDGYVALGFDVIIVIPMSYDTPRVAAAVKRATDLGIPVISFDRFLENPRVLYVGFDWVDVGRMEAKAMLAARPTGNYVIVKGDPTDPRTDMVRRGIGEVLGPALDGGAIKIVGEPTTTAWDPATAASEMSALLQKNTNKIDAVIAENDGLARGVIQSLKEVGLEGKVAVSGAMLDAGFPYSANYKAVATGEQIVDVFSDYRQLGTAAGRAALELCHRTDLSRVSDTAPFTTPAGTKLTSILLKSTPITVENLSVLVDTGWLTRDMICDDSQPVLNHAVCP